MFRLRPAIAVVCLVLAGLIQIPGAAMAQRDRASVPVSARPDAAAGQFFHDAGLWGRQVLGWMQAMVAMEHGYIVPIVPGETPPPPDPNEPTLPAVPEDPPPPAPPGNLAP